MGEEADWLADRALMELECDDEGVLIHGTILEPSTPKAILFRRKGDTEDTWLPRSQISNQGTDHIIISTWLAEKRDWWDDEEGIDGEIPF